MYIGARNIELSHNGKRLFDGFSFDAEEGRITGLSGPSGSGKSTLLHLLLGFTLPDKGDAIFMDRPMDTAAMRHFRENAGWLPQQLPNTTDTVWAFLFRAFEYRANLANRPPDAAAEELAALFLPGHDMKQQRMHELSGGERQRAGLIRLLLLRRRILLLDEPTSALDDLNRDLLAGYLAGLRDTTVLIATHDKVLLGYCHHVINL